MKSIHFRLDFYQLIKFTGWSHILESLANPKHFAPPRVTCFIYTVKKNQTSACYRIHLLENETSLSTQKPYRAHIDQKFAH